MEVPEPKVTVTAEYSRLLPALSKDEYNALKFSIKKNGLEQPIVLNQDGVILDGHNRWLICDDLGIKPEYVTKKFSDKLEETRFVIESNLIRRQLTDFARYEMALKLQPIYAKLSKENMRRGGKGVSIETPLGRTDHKVGEIVGLSETKLHKIKKILGRPNNGEVIEALRRGEISVDNAFKNNRVPASVQTKRPEKRDKTIAKPFTDLKISFTDSRGAKKEWTYQSGTLTRYVKSKSKQVFEIGWPQERRHKKETGYDHSVFESECDHKVESLKDYRFSLTKFDGNFKWFIENHHYSKSAEVAPMYCFKLECKCGYQIGAMIYSKPATNNTWKSYKSLGAETEEDVLELRRLCCVDNTPSLTESWFIGASLDWLVKNTDKKVVVSYADPDKGHEGRIYQASNFKYEGKSGASQVLQLPNGEIVHWRNTGWKDSPTSKEYRRMWKSGEAKVIKMPPKHRYSYNLEQHRHGKYYSAVTA